MIKCLHLVQEVKLDKNVIPEIPSWIQTPNYYKSGKSEQLKELNIKKPGEIHLLKEACRIARNTLVFAGTLVKPGVTTLEINDRVHEYIVFCFNSHIDQKWSVPITFEL